VTGPVSLLYAALRSMQAASSTLWQGARPLGHAARSAATLVRTSSLAATGSGASMADMGQQVSHCILFISYLTVWVMKPVVTHQTSWLESRSVNTGLSLPCLCGRYHQLANCQQVSRQQRLSLPCVYCHCCQVADCNTECNMSSKCVKHHESTVRPPCEALSAPMCQALQTCVHTQFKIRL
jgi:hypothetical protein